MLKKYNIAAKKIQKCWGEILCKPLCGSVTAEKLCHVKKKFDLFLHSR